MTGYQRSWSRIEATSRVTLVAVAAQEISIAPDGLVCASKRGSNTTKESAEVTSPCGERIVIGPSVASGGTVAVIRRSRLLVNALVNTALAPLKLTEVAPVKFVPNKVTLVPGVPVAGRELEVNPGAGVGYHLSVKLPTGGLLLRKLATVMK